jgi:hypothetical protein
MLDERRGAYLGVAIGDPESEVRRRFGKPRRAGPDECDICPTASPAGDELGAPTFIDSPPGPPGSTHELRYREVVFLASGGRVFGMLVADRRAATRRDVGIGDRLERAGDRYGEVDCGTGNEGSEYPEFRYCTGRVGRLFVSFGEDPIRSITVSSARLVP